jgi:hypothetical protein
MKKFLMLMLLVFAGCEKRQQTAEPMLSKEEGDYCVTVIVDTSGSFDQMMIEGGHAYRMLLAIIDKYFRERLGGNDRLVIAQISGNERALLWEGSPHNLRKDFPSPAAFSAFLRSKSIPAGSAVHKAITDSIEYVMDKPYKKSAVLVLSDMLDTTHVDFQRKTVEKLTEKLAQYGQRGGIVALYFVDQSLVSPWKGALANAGIREFIVESGIVSQPRLPNFD